MQAENRLSFTDLGIQLEELDKQLRILEDEGRRLEDVIRSSEFFFTLAIIHLFVFAARHSIMLVQLIKPPPPKLTKIPKESRRSGATTCFPLFT